MSTVKEAILNGEAVLGIELGSTRIKAVLIDGSCKPVASGSYDWENQLENGIWTYALDEVWKGLQGSYAALKEDVKRKYGVTLTKLGAVGISAMMHGYLVFDKDGNQLVPFRTWRNTITGQASQELTELFQFNIPQRWSIAHLYQAILNKEEHVPQIDFMTTLAGYIHWKLTGEKNMGVGEASGMFPIDSSTGQFHDKMLDQFQELIAPKGYPWKIREILPKVQTAGEQAGILTEKGAKLLDPAGELEAGAPLCPPEGDAGTGMTATNSVRARTGNVSAGTSVFAMIVLEHELKKVHEELDMIMTPDGSPVAMVHCNNCTSDLNAWVEIFDEFSALTGKKLDKGELFGLLYNHALTGDADCGGLLSYGYLSGEPVTGFEEGRPMFVRTPDSRFTLANFMRANLYSALATLKVGLDLMFQKEQVKLDCLMGHGGFFKTPGVGQRIMAAAASGPVAVMETAGEGGAWGIALLAAYMQRKETGETLEAFLQDKVFAGAKSVRMEPKQEDIAGFEKFMERYRAGLAAERAAVESLALWEED